MKRTYRQIILSEAHQNISQALELLDCLGIAHDDTIKELYKVHSETHKRVMKEVYNEE